MNKGHKRHPMSAANKNPMPIYMIALLVLCFSILTVSGHSLPTHSASGPTIVRCWSDRRQIFAAQRKDAICQQQTRAGRIQLL